MREIEDLVELMARLRHPDSGCPWDREQTYDTIVPHTIEEAYEVADAIARGDRLALKDELGDLLFQVVFYTQLAREENLFTLADVARAIIEKMTRRHPHVFGDAEFTGPEEQSRDWERIKQAERGTDAGGVLDGVALALPAMTRALKLQRRAARVGFDWKDAESVLHKIEEELEEVRLELARGECMERCQEEVGDLLFACVNLARHVGIDPEAAVRATNAKFERRFRCIETGLAETGRTPDEASLAEMDALWEQAKTTPADDRPPRQQR